MHWTFYIGVFISCVYIPSICGKMWRGHPVSAYLFYIASFGVCLTLYSIFDIKY